jgi:hypothetical protein
LLYPAIIDSTKTTEDFELNIMIDEFINDLRPAREKIAFINESAYEHNLTDEDIYYVIDNYIGMFEVRGENQEKIWYVGPKMGSANIMEVLIVEFIGNIPAVIHAMPATKEILRLVGLR